MHDRPLSVTSLECNILLDSLLDELGKPNSTMDGFLSEAEPLRTSHFLTEKEDWMFCFIRFS